MASRIPAKSILKQPRDRPGSTESDEQKAKAERDRRNLGIALHHAHKIQAQKNAEAGILTVIETLLDHPASSVSTAVEALSFASIIVPFQPSDFDSLVEERRIAGKCGYALCANPPRIDTIGKNAAWKLKGKGAADYCSHECLQKGLYVKTQLSEVPAWERRPGEEPQIILPPADRPESAVSAAFSADHRSSERRNQSQELALERGEDARSFRPNQVILDTIVEKRGSPSQSQSFEPASEPSHDSIEGYLPTRTTRGSAQGPDLSTEDDRSIRTTRPALSTLDNNGEVDEEEESWKALYENLPADQ